MHAQLLSASSAWLPLPSDLAVIYQYYSRRQSYASLAIDLGSALSVRKPIELRSDLEYLNPFFIWHLCNQNLPPLSLSLPLYI